MRVYCCQFNVAWEDAPANHARVRAMLEAARLERGSLVLLPEMFATGFSMNVAAVTDEPVRATEAFLRQTAIDLDITLMGGVVTGHANSGGYNESVVFGPDGIEIARYRKLHPFSYAGETRHYRSGTQVAQFDWGGFIVAPFICYDLRFPEAFRISSRRGAQVLTVIANWPLARESHWLTLLRARAIENQAYVVAVNRVGSDPNATYGGRSQVIDPRGEILTDAGTVSSVISAELDLESLLKYRMDFPALVDMRADLLPPT